MSNSARLQAHLTWIIDNFESSLNELRIGEKYVKKSPHFLSAENTLKWYLELRIDRESDTKHDTKLYLEIANRPELCKYGPIKGEYEFSFVDSEGKKVSTNTEQFRFDFTQDSTKINNFPRHVSRLFKKKCVHKNQLTIYSKVSYTRETESDIFSTMDRFGTYKEDFEEYLNNEKSSDVTVYVGDKKFPCHKIILETRSSVFKAMLAHDMKEKNSNRIDIHDIDENVFQQVLRFIYTWKLDISETMTVELLQAADKYDLTILKAMCEKQLYEMLTVDNSVETLSISNKYNMNNLKSKVTEFIQGNLKEIARTDAWNDFQSQPDLMKIVLDAFAK